jgi:hypothetical protein
MAFTQTFTVGEKGRFGMSWQVALSGIQERLMLALCQMKKIDLPEIKRLLRAEESPGLCSSLMT